MGLDRERDRATVAQPETVSELDLSHQLDLIGWVSGFVRLECEPTVTVGDAYRN